MSEDDETAWLAAARAGDHEAFARLTDPYRRELLVHCYRILGSFEDAEDALQETWLRAWRRLETFEGRAPLRAWLYKIATHAAFDVARTGQRARRSLPTLTLAPADPGDPLPPPSQESRWIDPLPDEYLPASTETPEAVYDARESVALAFLALLQHLPARQRAALILRDVLGWPVAEIAELLETSVAAVNSALQRARATMKAHQPVFPDGPAPDRNDERTTALLAHYVRAWETGDTAALVSLLHEDAVLMMPPLPMWLRGRSAIAEFVARHLFAADARGHYRLVATRANGCPAYAVYQRDASGLYRPSALQVLTIAHGRIVEMCDYLTFDHRLFAWFGLPPLG